MNKRVLITGATGLIGKKIVNELCSKGAFVKILVRNVKQAKEIFRDQLMIEIYDLNIYKDPVMLKPVMEEIDAVINLAGANVGAKKWDEDIKKEIYQSRIKTTRLLTESIRLAASKPECFLSASGIGYYGFRGDEMLTEDSASGDDFLAVLCRDWEYEAMKVSEYGVRVVTMRTGIVLDKKEGALPQMLLPYKFFTESYQGNGRQWFSWIHIDDIAGIFVFALNETGINGAVNAVSPEPVRAAEFSKMISRFKKTFIKFPVPEFLLKIIAGEFAKNLVTGQRVSCDKILRSGYKFRFPELHKALEDLLS